ncbi:MAG TPA: VOC family protein [Bryobacteraceae bacterium]|nr:VOC family protein [Bryobacteraceae bacterium]
MRTSIFLFALVTMSSIFGQSTLPITGISHVAFRVSDLEKAKAFYTGVLGYEEAFHLKNAEGGTAIAFMKVNDDQYIELQPGLKEGEDVRLTHVSFVTTNAAGLHQALSERGLNPTEVRTGKDGNRSFRVTDPEGNPLEFTEYVAGSLHSNARGKFDSSKRISKQLLHAGLPVTRSNMDATYAFYRDKLGFTEFWRGGPEGAPTAWINMRTPGSRGDYVELMLHDGSPSRTQRGSMQHICLLVPNIPDAHKVAVSRGIPADEQRFAPRVGRNRKRQLNLFDPDGSRTELMEPKTVDEQ